MSPPAPEFPEAVSVPPKKGLPLIWLVPLVAVLIGIGLVIKTALERGPEIVVTFKNAHGIEPGKTKVQYKNVEIGLVERVDLTPAYDQVEVRIRMNKSAEPLLVEDTRFWVERPRIRGTSVEGLNTLLSGAYIGMDIGRAKAARRDFVGLERPPLVAMTEPGRRFRLRAEQLGSIESGSAVFYRRLVVGQVLRYEMDQAGKGVEIEIFVREPYERFVKASTRFWESSGIELEMNAQGIRFETPSVNALLAGGIAFETPDAAEDEPPAAEESVFQLYARKSEAMAQEELATLPMRLIFNESVRGLAVGAPVDFRGIVIGQVKAIGAHIEREQGIVKMLVDVDLYPERLRLDRTKRGLKSDLRPAIDALVAGGLRAQLRTGNWVSGQLLVALDYFKNTPRAVIDWQRPRPIFPTIPGSLTSLEEQAGELMRTVNALLKKLDAVPLERLTEDVRGIMQSLDRSMRALEKTLASVDRQLADDAALQTDVRDALREVERAAAEARHWLEYQSRHPESLLMGKPKED